MIKYGIDLTAKYIIKYVWGDVFEYEETHDCERTSHILIERIALNPYTRKITVQYKFVYEGNKEPNAIFSDTLNEFKEIFKIQKY